MNTKTALIVVAAAFLALAGCKKKNKQEPKNDPAGPTQPKVVDPGPSVPKAKTATKIEIDPKTGRPKPKGLTYPTDDKLGKAPEGVGLAVGTKAPDGKLADMAGKPVQLAAALGKKPTLVIFYRGAWCPYCNMQVHKMAITYDDFAERGVNVIMISADKPSEAAKTAKTYEVAFPLLHDPDMSTHAAYNVVHTATPQEVAEKKARGQDIEAMSGAKHHKWAVPSIFLVDAEGTIKWVHADRDQSLRPSTDQLLEMLDKQGYKPQPAKKGPAKKGPAKKGPAKKGPAKKEPAKGDKK